MVTDSRDTCAILVASPPDANLIWREVAGQPLIAWSVAAFAAAPSVAHITLVVPEAQAGHAEALREQVSWEKVSALLPGDVRRRACVEAALRALPDDCALVAIHDATRPLVTPALIEAGVALARATGVAIPTEPVKETIKRVRDEVIVGAVPRERLTRAQTPQFLSRTLVRQAYQRAEPELDPPDEATLLLTLGMAVTVYAGDAENLRVTSVGELPVVEELLRRRLG
jgi:2-C-methyl-D-erythritol 4-phosphate cytidylyltransferase